MQSSVGHSARNESLEALERLRRMFILHMIIDQATTNQEPVVLVPHHQRR